MKSFRLNMLSCNRDYYHGDCEYITLPLEDGSMGILADHEDMFIAFEIGEITFRRPGMDDETVVVSNGFAEVKSNEVTVMAMSIERPEEIDYNRALEAKQRAEEKLIQKRSILEYQQSKLSMARAIERMKAAGGKK